MTVLTGWSEAVAGRWAPPAKDTTERYALARRTGHMWLARLEKRAARLKTARLRRRARGMAKRLAAHLDADILRAEGNLDGYLMRLSGRVEVR